MTIASTTTLPFASMTPIGGTPSSSSGTSALVDYLSLLQRKVTAAYPVPGITPISAAGFGTGAGIAIVQNVVAHRRIINFFGSNHEILSAFRRGYDALHRDYQSLTKPGPIAPNASPEDKLKQYAMPHDPEQAAVVSLMHFFSVTDENRATEFFRNGIALAALNNTPPAAYEMDISFRLKEHLKIQMPSLGQPNNTRLLEQVMISIRDSNNLSDPEGLFEKNYLDSKIDAVMSAFDKIASTFSPETQSRVDALKRERQSYRALRQTEDTIMTPLKGVNIQELERQIKDERLIDTEAQLKQARTTGSQMQRDLVQIQQDLQRISSHLKNTSAEIEQARNQAGIEKNKTDQVIKTLEAQIASLNHEVAEKDRELNDISAAQKATNLHINALIPEKERLENEIQQITQKLSTATADLLQTRADLYAEIVKLNDREEKIRQLEEEKSTLETQLNASTNGQGQGQQGNSQNDQWTDVQLESTVNFLNQRLEEIENEKTRMMEAYITELDNIEKGLLKNYTEKQQQVQQLEVQLKAITEQLNSLKNEKQKLEQQLTQEKETNQSLRREISDLKNEVEGLKKALQNSAQDKPQFKGHFSRVVPPLPSVEDFSRIINDPTQTLPSRNTAVRSLINLAVNGNNAAQVALTHIPEDILIPTNIHWYTRTADEKLAPAENLRLQDLLNLAQFNQKASALLLSSEAVEGIKNHIQANKAYAWKDFSVWEARYAQATHPNTTELTKQPFKNPQREIFSEGEWIAEDRANMKDAFNKLVDVYNSSLHALYFVAMCVSLQEEKPRAVVSAERALLESFPNDEIRTILKQQTPLGLADTRTRERAIELLKSCYASATERETIFVGLQP